MTVDELPSWVTVFPIEDGGQYYVEASHWDELSAAMGAWADRRIDRLLTLTALSGAEVMIAASRIGDAIFCTPASRAREREIQAASKAEQGFVDE